MGATAEAQQREGTPLEQPALGRRLRTIRTYRGHALAAVSEGTGLSKSFIAVVERGGSDISLGRLYRLLRFYGIGLDALLTPDPSLGAEHHVVRGGDGRRIQLLADVEGVHESLLAPTPNRLMMPVLSVREPGSRVADVSAHEGDLFIYVIEGALLVEPKNQDSFVLHPGDSCYITREESMTTTAVDERPSKIVAVVAPPLF